MRIGPHLHTVGFEMVVGVGIPDVLYEIRDFELPRSFHFREGIDVINAHIIRMEGSKVF